MSRNYKTQGKEKLISFLSENPDTHFTVEEICMQLNGSTSCQSSVYRNLGNLCREGSVRRFESNGNNKFLYQYVGSTSCNNHFHLKCIKCESIVHLECDMSDSMKNHVLHHHGFKIDSGRSILYGYCKSCLEGEGGA